MLIALHVGQIWNQFWWHHLTILTIQVEPCTYNWPLEPMQVVFYLAQEITQVIDSRLYTEKVTVSSGAIWWPNLELMQVVPSGGQICN